MLSSHSCVRPTFCLRSVTQSTGEELHRNRTADQKAIGMQLAWKKKELKILKDYDLIKLIKSKFHILILVLFYFFLVLSD